MLHLSDGVRTATKVAVALMEQLGWEFPADAPLGVRKQQIISGVEERSSSSVS